MSSSTLLCNSHSNVSNSTTSLSRRRRFYQSPGLMDALSPSVSRTSSLRSQVKTLGSVLEERAKLVKRTLTGYSHVGRTCSTPTRSSLAACKFLKDTTTNVETCMQGKCICRAIVYFLLDSFQVKSSLVRLVHT